MKESKTYNSNPFHTTIECGTNCARVPLHTYWQFEMHILLTTFPPPPHLYLPGVNMNNK